MPVLFIRSVGCLDYHIAEKFLYITSMVLLPRDSWRGWKEDDTKVAIWQIIVPVKCSSLRMYVFLLQLRLN